MRVMVQAGAWQKVLVQWSTIPNLAKIDRFPILKLKVRVHIERDISFWLTSPVPRPAGPATENVSMNTKLKRKADDNLDDRETKKEKA